jgi:hypothetical protein
MGNWTLFSNHGHVLVCLVNDPESRLRDVALQVGITERAVQKIVRDLQDVGMLSVTKDGRRNRYRIDKSQPLRHELESHCTVADLIRFVQQDAAQKRAEPQPAKEPPAAVDVEVAKPKAPAAEPAGAPKPEPKPESKPESKPEPEPEPEPEPPAPTPPVASEPDTKKKKKPEPEADILMENQQGSLF